MIPILIGVLVSAGQSVPTKVTASEMSVEVVAFDCLEYDREWTWPMENGLSQWKGGGPSGASWNTEALRRTAELKTDCPGGVAQVEFYVGSRRIRTARLSFSPKAPLPRLYNFTVTDDQWEPGLDRPRKQLFRTGIFRVMASLWSCGTEGSGPDHSEKNFVAGFAGKGH